MITMLLNDWNPCPIVRIKYLETKRRSMEELPTFLPISVIFSNDLFLRLILFLEEQRRLH